LSFESKHQQQREFTQRSGIFSIFLRAVEKSLEKVSGRERKVGNMKQVLFIAIAYFCAHAVCQEFQELENYEVPSTDRTRPSMLGMLSKYMEMNGTFDEVTKGSMTENYGSVWLNATAAPTNGECEMEETFIEEVSITDRIPYQVEVEVWCWSIRCTEWETRYREQVTRKNVTKTRLVFLVNHSA
jgi:hypothetical protein